MRTPLLQQTIVLLTTSLGLLAGCASPATVLPNAQPPPEPTHTQQSTPTAHPTTEASPLIATEQALSEPTPVVFDPVGLNAGPGSSFVALDDPTVIPGIQATWLDPDELVLGVTAGDAARAYPISQMAYHHIANDQIDGEPYLVTY